MLYDGYKHFDIYIAIPLLLLLVYSFVCTFNCLLFWLAQMKQAQQASGKQGLGAGPTYLTSPGECLSRG